MRVHNENIPAIDRYIENSRYTLEEKRPEYERMLRFIGRARPVEPGMRMLEVGTGTGWFPLLCRMDGLDCKGLEISPQLLEVARLTARRYGLEADFALGNVEDCGLGEEEYDVIVASSVFEHVELWRPGVEAIYRALKPGGVFFFESSNKFTLDMRGSEYPKLPFYGWLPDRLRYALRRKVHGPDIMKLGIDFHQFTYPGLRRWFRQIGFRRILDTLDLLEPERMPASRRVLIRAGRRSRLARNVVLCFLLPATTFVCVK